MEFKFRAVDNRPQSNLAASDGFDYLGKQAMRDGLLINIPRKPDLMENPKEFQLREVVQREREKEQIRQKIIAEELVMRRVLEAEVRREMAIEREMSIRRAAERRLSLGDSLTMLFDPCLPSGYLYENGSLEERLASRAASDGGGFNMLFPSPMSRLSEAMGTESAKVMPPSVSNKDKLIVLARPKPNLTRAKRKAEAVLPVGDDELPLLAPKNSKKEWSCALCQVSVTSERTLNEHLQGKKHKAKEAGLRASKGENYCSLSLPKRIQKVSENTESTSNAESKWKTKIEEELLQIDKIGQGFDQKEGKDSKNKNDELLSEKKARDEMTSKIPAESAGGETPKSQKNFKYWCELCLIGTYSEVVMEDHKKGKRHAALLRELSINGVSVKTNTATDGKAIVKYQLGGEESEKTADIADGGGSSGYQEVNLQGAMLKQNSLQSH